MTHEVTTSGSGNESLLLARAAAFPEYPELANLTRETLREVSARNGVDFATALLYDRVKRCPQHARFIARIDQLQQRERPGAFARDATVAIVPAAFYQEKPHSGADGRVVREAATRLGFRCELIPLASTGTLAENSRILRDWLVRQRDERVILVSLCKGGADVKFALSAPEAAAHFSKVVAWVNICGTLNGSPVAQWLLATKSRAFAAWLFCKCGGHNFTFLREIAPSPSGPLSAPLHVPPAMRLIHLVGFPLRQHLTNGFMRRGHKFISPLGPNDGGVLLADACHLPGQVYPVWGADHYLRPEARARKIIAAVLQQLAPDDSPKALSPANETPAIDRIARTPSV